MAEILKLPVLKFKITMIIHGTVRESGCHSRTVGQNGYCQKRQQIINVGLGVEKRQP